jgi:methylamine--corrinoid protein Co-methyltransferase
VFFDDSECHDTSDEAGEARIVIRYLEVVDRAMTGQYCKEMDFTMKVLVPKLKQLVVKHGIKYDPDIPVPYDDDLADRVFQAGFELYRDVGLYCPDSQRIMRFTEEELLQALKDSPAETVLGEGKQQRTLVPRQPDSDVPPWCWLGALGAAVSNEESYSSIMEAYATYLPLADSITAPSLASFNGRTVRTGTPLEVIAAMRVTSLGKDALRRGNRPGLPIMNSIATAGSDVAKIAGSSFGLQTWDTWVVGHTAEFKLGFERLNEIAWIIGTGGGLIAECAPILGGYCGGPEGVAVANAAYLLSGIIAMQADALLTFPTHFNLGCTTERSVIWAKSVSVQAMTRNSHFPVFVDHYTAHGPMTEMFFYENAADVIASVVSGGHVTATGSAKGTHIDHFTPMEPRFSGEVAHGSAGMTREEANEIVKRLLERYESTLAHASPGQTYEECWDTRRKEPNPEYVELYESVTRNLADLGVRVV